MRDNKGRTVLMHMFLKPNKHAPREYFQNQLDNIIAQQKGMQDNAGWTAFMYACYNGYYEDARLLLSEAELCAKDGTTPLMCIFGSQCVSEGIHHFITDTFETIFQKQFGKQDANG